MEVVELINTIIGIAFAVCYAYQFFYILVALLVKGRPHKEARPHRIAILISARNEELVIEHLLDSIRKQTYSSELIKTFVIADNCTDNTAKLSRDNGAIVYERDNKEKVGKGYALEYLYECICRDFGKDAFDAFLVVDADNVLTPTFVEEMNKTFSDGYEIVTCYRNSKNYGDNWISAGYGLWFLRESVYLNKARMILKTSCAVSGTGFMFASSVIEETGGWKCFLLTEDIEFTIDNVLKGRKIGYAKDAMLYDEQPVTFRQSWRQRMRWAKGYIQVIKKFWLKLIRGIFTRKFTSCYDMTMVILPAVVGTVASLLTLLGGLIYGLIAQVDLAPLGIMALKTFGMLYLTVFIVGFIATISEWKNLKTNWFKKIFYMFTFPLFMMTYIPISIVAVFKRVKWEPIDHSRSISIDQIEEKKKNKKNKNK